MDTSTTQDTVQAAAESAAASGPVTDTLSVVIPAHNEEAYIGLCLEALVAQGDDVHEIIVADNNSTDHTVAVVEAFAEAHPKIVLLSERSPGVAHARNAGFRAATGDISAASMPTLASDRDGHVQSWTTSPPKARTSVA